MLNSPSPSWAQRTPAERELKERVRRGGGGDGGTKSQIRAADGTQGTRVFLRQKKEQKGKEVQRDNFALFFPREKKKNPFDRFFMWMQ